ncbi:MAG: hypothetical protein ABIO99_09410 [Candidatus Limnocylindria bacterium]
MQDLAKRLIAPMAVSDTAMGGTFDVNMGVLERIVATIRFIGTVQWRTANSPIAVQRT